MGQVFFNYLPKDTYLLTFKKKLKANPLHLFAF